MPWTPQFVTGQGQAPAPAPGAFLGGAQPYAPRSLPPSLLNLATVNPTWPASLPQNPEWQTFSDAPQDNAVRFVPQVGPPKARRRGTASASIQNLSFQMTTAQWTTLMAFYRVTLTETLSFTGSGGLAFSGIFAFTAPPKRTGIGPDLFEVTCPLLLLP